MAKLQAPSGFRDFLPDQVRKRAELMRRIRDVYESFGFEPMETPTIENLPVLLGKGGGENEKLMFRVLKRGAELERALTQHSELADLGLRFDLTVPLARYYATHRAELPAVFKRYQMAPVFRAERPQHGRFREFIQCDVDILGSRSVMAEIEVMVATSSALAALGFRDLEIRLNSRPLLTALVQALGVPESQVGAALVIIDKQDKVPAAELAKELEVKGIEASAAGSLLDFMGAMKRKEPAERFAMVEEKVGAAGAEQISRLREIQDLAPPLASGRIVFDPFLARGLDYYTGPIFEVTAEGVPFTLAGGGRFDGLVGTLSGADVPAVGFSIGFERVCTLLDERGMLDQLAKTGGVFVAVPDPSIRRQAVALAAEARASGLVVDLYVGAAKLGAQLELAQKKGLTWAIVTDPAELEQGRVVLRNLSDRQNILVPRGELRDRLLQHCTGALTQGTRANGARP